MKWISVDLSARYLMQIFYMFTTIDHSIAERCPNLEEISCKMPHESALIVKNSKKVKIFHTTTIVNRTVIIISSDEPIRIL